MKDRGHRGRHPFRAGHLNDGGVDHNYVVLDSRAVWKIFYDVRTLQREI